jgi:hypothetical protein
MKAPDPILRTRDPELQDWVDRVNLILNAGKYEFFVTNTVPTEQANVGEQKVYQSDDGTLRRFYVFINGIWCSINFSSSGDVSTGAFGDRILDDDKNTGIFTQFTTNEDRLRHYSAGVYVMAVDTYGIQIASDYKMVFDGLGGDTYWTYSSASSYLQCYINGTLRMEM